MLAATLVPVVRLEFSHQRVHVGVCIIHDTIVDNTIPTRFCTMNNGKKMLEGMVADTRVDACGIAVPCRGGQRLCEADRREVGSETNQTPAPYILAEYQ